MSIVKAAMRFSGLVLVVAIAPSLVGCGGTSVPENVIAKSVNLLEELRVQVQGKEYDAALKTVEKLQENGSIGSASMTEFLALKARSEIGAGNSDAAVATINTLEAGTDELGQVYLLRGELEMKKGNRSGAQTEFAKAKKADSTITIPKF